MQERKKHSLAFRSLLNSSGLVLLIVISLGLLAGGYFLQDKDKFQFHSIGVETDAAHISPQRLQKAIKLHLHGGFFTLNAGELERGLRQALPWVQQVRVRRIWPDRLVVKITERHAIAYWNKVELVSEQGVLFRPAVNTFPSGLVYLSGNNDQFDDVFLNYYQFSSSLKEMNTRISQLSVSALGEWRFKLANGVEAVLGKGETQGRFERFVVFYYQVVMQSKRKVLRIDLRYRNGLAVKWAV
jgi:cell division protein FtsQ